MRGNSPVPRSPRDSLRAFSGCHDPVCPRVFPRDCGSSSYRTPRHMPAAAIHPTVHTPQSPPRQLISLPACSCPFGPGPTHSSLAVCGSAQPNGVYTASLATAPESHHTLPRRAASCAVAGPPHLVPRRLHARGAAWGGAGMLCTLLRCASPHRCGLPSAAAPCVQRARLCVFSKRDDEELTHDLAPDARGRTATRDTVAVDDAILRLLPPPCGGHTGCASPTGGVWETLLGSPRSSLWRDGAPRVVWSNAFNPHVAASGRLCPWWR
jgi:hypothetical protein